MSVSNSDFDYSAGQRMPRMPHVKCVITYPVIFFLIHIAILSEQKKWYYHFVVWFYKKKASVRKRRDPLGKLKDLSSTEEGM